MKARSRKSYFATAIILSVVIAGYYEYLSPGHLQREAVSGAKHFYAHQDSYNKLLDNWSAIWPQKCGIPTGIPGFISFESITKESDGSLTLATSDANYQKLSMPELATRLNAKPEILRSALDTMAQLKSPEIFQAGGDVKIMSAQNDTIGYLHIDPSCPNAADISFWSKQPNNFKAENPGHYVGLKSLGSGWYYYMEQR